MKIICYYTVTPNSAAAKAIAEHDERLSAHVAAMATFLKEEGFLDDTLCQISKEPRRWAWRTWDSGRVCGFQISKKYDNGLTGVASVNEHREWLKLHDLVGRLRIDPKDGFIVPNKSTAAGKALAKKIDGLPKMASGDQVTASFVTGVAVLYLSMSGGCGLSRPEGYAPIVTLPYELVSQPGAIITDGLLEILPSVAGAILKGQPNA